MITNTWHPSKVNGEPKTGAKEVIPMETVIYWLGVLTLCIGVPTLTMRVVDWLDKLHSNTKKGGCE